ncbi:hypothetical protein Terro_0838 [Terriglobus roseus DSM 18391]|uniref:3-keto-disaccharide hydrolase domain-containing protein n=1 Tax=Terriglobus roseus (strain DSM 18391 / NRRL B-41598 / KBS 63) TaxID=926566 RepID=I3ZD47_TERRK|nr:hypothetical protein [Terriglobus roseus]AFL87165.1 hypothetical protein Terro_0838 [Terriglobus roseus DSM 18391]
MKIFTGALSLLCIVVPLTAQAPGPLELHNVKSEVVTYSGRQSVQITDDGPETLGDAGRLAVLHRAPFLDGVIEMDIAGDTVPNAAPSARGFVGVAFRVSADRTRFECLYLRPKNGRAEDQLQRNHSMQYISHPGYPWEKLRSETPGKYEAYADMVAGKWIHVKIEVNGQRARLYLNGAEQPSLLVNDLKQTPASGDIALWVGPQTVAHFANLNVHP